MWKLTRTLLGHDGQNIIIKTDPTWGFSEFPEPGDTKKHLLPVLVDAEEAAALANREEDDDDKNNGRKLKEFWMPDKYCKVCFQCEEPFTMYRRRHHCRMCGQIFCNNCSAYSIDGAMFNQQGVVRSCQLCYEQQSQEKVGSEVKQSRRKVTEKNFIDASNAQMRELNAEYKKHHQNLQNRASAHLGAIVDRLVNSSDNITSNHAKWKELIVELVNGVVSSVDPDVRGGDCLDIRPYVKIKVIPGGDISECTYVDGVVFRKNVSHKKMAISGVKENPRILLLAGGVEFQRADLKLSSMDTLIEQESKFMEILVDKIMSLRPDIIMVGKAVARKAQELLCEHRVVVLQNVKMTVLERMARMTGAMLLPSTDNIISQYGEDCLGSCGRFWHRLVQDDPERSNNAQPRRILHTRISRASTYAYFEGCPPERGCTIVLRGEKRKLLSEIKRIIRFCVFVAYHLRLEVSYYNDRFANLPFTIDEEYYDDGSDVDDETIDENFNYSNNPNISSTVAAFVSQNASCLSRKERYYLSTSMDIDFSIPYRRELLGSSLFRSKNLTKCSVESQQSLLIASLLMGEGPSNVPVQKHYADVKGIKYYTNHDVALGQFILENCFQMSRGILREPKFLDQTLSFVHRPGRIDVTVRKIDRNQQYVYDENALIAKDYRSLNIYIASYCKDCGKTVTPQHMISEEMWKMSFGKFLEIYFYNRSAHCTVGGCTHSLRDSHILSFSCENYQAVFEYFPMHPYALRVREGMLLPEEFYMKQAAATLESLPEKFQMLVDDFAFSVYELEKEIQDILSSRPADLSMAMADIRMIGTELQITSIRFLEGVLRTYEALPKKYLDKQMEQTLKLLVSDKMHKYHHKSEKLLMDADGDRGSVSERMASTAEDEDVSLDLLATEINPAVAVKFPMIHFRDIFVKAARWNARIDTIYGYLDSVRSLALQHSQSIPLPPVSATTAFVSNMPPIAESDEVDEGYIPYKKSGDLVITVDVVKPTNATTTLLDIEPADVMEDEVTSTRVTEIQATAVPVDIAAPPTTVNATTPTNGIPLAGPVESVAASPHNQQGSSLYKAAIEQTRKTADKPIDKMSRITKALSRFLVGTNKDNATEETDHFAVQLGDFGAGRYGLKPGRNGVVVPVSEDVLASIIAYTLASEEYHNDLEASLREDNVDQLDTEAMNDLDNVNPLTLDEINNTTPTLSEAAPTKSLTGQPFLSSDNDSGTTPAKEGFSIAPIMGAFKRKDKSAVEDPSLPAITENREEDNDLDNDEHDMKSNGPKINNYGLTSLMKNFSSSEDLVSNDGGVFGGDNILFHNEGRSTANNHLDHHLDHAGNHVGIEGFPKEKNLLQERSANMGTSHGLDDNNKSFTADAPFPAEDERPSDSAHLENMSVNEKQMMSQDKSNIRHRFDDADESGNLLCKFQCQVYWAKQFEAVRCCYFKDEDYHESYIRSLALSTKWVAQGGKSGASFAKTADERLVIKVVSRVELQMYLDFAPAYFEYMAKAYYHNLPTVLCKILGVYTVRFDNKETGKKGMENVVVMENIFYNCKITKTFDLKGSSRARYVELAEKKFESLDEGVLKRRKNRRKNKGRSSSIVERGSVRDSTFRPTQSSGGTAGEGDDVEVVNTIPQVLLDDNLMEFTRGRPFPLKHRAKLFFHKAVQNDTLFLSIVNVVDYSILVGFDENSHEMVVGIIDYLRQYDIIKKMERVGKGSVGMLTGQAEPTIIQPSQYRKRFTLAMDRYFMTVPDKWISYDG